jgi:hypothetical protein
MRSALNEACDIAKKKRTWRFQTGPSNWERVDIGLCPDDDIRITELRELTTP